MQEVKSVIEFGTNKWRIAVMDSLGETVFYKDYPSKRNMTDSKIGEDYLFACLNAFSDELKKYNLDIADNQSVRAIATEGFRDGENADELIAKIKEKMKVEIEIISAKREAELSAKAVISDSPDKNKLIIDMGGGSTDIALYSAEEKRVVGTVSLIGSRFLLEGLDADKDNRQKIFSEEEKKLHQTIEDFKKNSNFDLYADNLDIITNSSAMMRVISKKEGHEKFEPKEIDGKTQKALDVMISMEELFQMKPKEVVDNGYSGFKAAPQTITGAFILKETLAALEVDKNQEIKVSLKSPKDGLIIEMFTQEKQAAPLLEVSDNEVVMGQENTDKSWQERYNKRLEKLAKDNGAEYKGKIIDENLVALRKDEVFVYSAPNRLNVKGGKSLDGWRDQILNAQEEGLSSIDFSKVSKEENKARLYLLCSIYGLKPLHLTEEPNVADYLGDLTADERRVFDEKTKNKHSPEGRKEKLEELKKRVEKTEEAELAPAESVVTPRVPKKLIKKQNLK